MPESEETPVWAGPRVYPEKPPFPAFGALSGKGRRSEFETPEALAEHVRGSRESVVAVWTPLTERMVPPEAVPDLLEPLRRRFLDLAEVDRADARRNSIIFVVLLGWAVYAAAARGLFPQDSVTVGIAAVLLLMLGLLPWYDAWKNARQAWELNEDNLDEEEAEARFDYWLRNQRGFLTIVLLGFLTLAGAGQIWIGVNVSVEAAGLVKPKYFGGEWWRLFTAPFLHGHPLHWVLNAIGIWYVGKRVEALARWPHLVLVFLIAMVAGGIATANLAPTLPSIGASGGLLGLLGFLLVFETLHPRLVPQSARRRLFAAVAFTFVVGFVGYRFIDNYAHAGGLAAGVLYAVIVFPKSRSARRPRAAKLDLAAGALAVGALTASVVLAVIRIWQT